MTAITAEIINEFVEQIDTEKEYDLKEMKQILSDVYKAKTQKPKAIKEAKPTKAPKTVTTESDSDDDDKPKKRGRPVKVRLDKDGNEKAKRAPSGYNIYMGQRIKVLKIEQPDTPAKELLKIAASEWKTLDKATQEQYKAQNDQV